MATHGLTFVIVGFAAEFPLLQLQARSMAAFVPEGLVREILVIDNSADGMPPRVAESLMNGYGRLSRLVRVVRPEDVCVVPPVRGWQSQQLLKLRAADLVTTDRYAVLDAKNHFVEPLRGDFFEAPDGRARVNVYSYEAHPLRPALERVLDYLGLDPADHVGRFTATVTPFVLDTGIVRAMMRDIECRSGRSFEQEFVARDLTEFFLYAGWIIADGRSLEDTYEFHQVFCPNVWWHSASLAGVRKAVRAARERQTPLFSVHRLALARLNRDSRSVLADFWADRGLFASHEEAHRFLMEFRRAMYSEVLRELLHEAMWLPRRMMRRVLHRISRPTLSPASTPNGRAGRLVR